jgi:hypothetical protein
MTKTSDSFDPHCYAPVAERITLFYQRHPTGRIVTELVSRSEHDVLFKAFVYRAYEDDRPAATGWAAEREGDGDVNLVACLENTETSAIGRALANLGFTAGRQRPSAEEMQKAARARLRLARASATTPPQLSDDPVQRRANLLVDLLRSIARAEQVGLRTARAERWRTWLVTNTLETSLLLRLEQRLRVWTAKQRREVR